MQIWPGHPYPLGATYDGTGTNLALFSSAAEAVDRCLIDDEGNDIGFLDREFRLACSQRADAFLLARQSARIDNDEFARAETANAVMTIARQPRQVGDQRVARTRERIEQGGFADIGAADEGDDGKHVRSIAEMRSADDCRSAVLALSFNGEGRMRRFCSLYATSARLRARLRP